MGAYEDNSQTPMWQFMIAYNKEHSCSIDYKDLSDITDDNRLEVEAEFPASLLKMLDPSVEYLRYEKKGLKKDYFGRKAWSVIIRL